MTWTQYAGGRSTPHLGDEVSIRQTGLTLPVEFLDKNPEFAQSGQVSLFWDRESRSLGIKPAKEGEYGAVKMYRYRTGNNHGIVGTKRFIKEANARPGVYSYRKDGDMVVLEDAIQ